MSNNENLLEPSLTRKLLLQHHPNQRITNDAVNAANELLRLFIIEARHRAAVEVRSLICVIFSTKVVGPTIPADEHGMVLLGLCRVP
jgi:hypothetical protein